MNCVRVEPALKMDIALTFSAVYAFIKHLATICCFILYKILVMAWNCQVQKESVIILFSCSFTQLIFSLSFWVFLAASLLYVFIL